MRRIPDDIKQEILDRSDLVGLISEVVPLKPAGGSRFMGLCPFHKDKDPSFSVNADKGFYYCFGCHESGDAITFLMKSEGMAYGEALESLAKKAGVRIPEESPERARIREGQLYILDAAAQYFEENLQAEKGRGCRKILKERGLDEGTIARFRIGYAPPGWHHLLNYLRRKGARDEDVIKAGLAVSKEEGEPYDRFRNRIIFPIMNVSGKVIAFGGRKIDPDDEPKYLNSPETDVFKKAYTLYGLDQAKKEIQEKTTVCLVEGYMDVIAMHQHGITNVAGTLGPALTNHHWNLLKRYAKTLYLLFDGDQAGRRAALRALDVLLPEEVLPLVIELPGEKDPDDFIREEGREGFERELAGARDPVDYRMDCLLQGKGKLSREDKVEAVREMVALLRHASNPIRRSDWVARVARRLKVREDDIFEQVRSSRKKKQDVVLLEEKFAELDPVVQAKEGLIATVLAGKDIGGILRKLVDERDRKVDVLDEILEGLLEIVEGGDDITRGKIGRRFSDDMLSTIARIEATVPVSQNYVKAARDFVYTIQQGAISEKLDGIQSRGEEEVSVLFESLNEEMRLHRQRIGLGMGEGFRS